MSKIELRKSSFIGTPAFLPTLWAFESAENIFQRNHWNTHTLFYKSNEPKCKQSQSRKNSLRIFHQKFRIHIWATIAFRKVKWQLTNWWIFHHMIRLMVDQWFGSILKISWTIAVSTSARRLFLKYPIMWIHFFFFLFRSVFQFRIETRSLQNSRNNVIHLLRRSAQINFD